jgi:two-component system, response regulator
MTGQSILLVEDNPDDEALTLRGLQKNNILNEVNVARDGAEALAFLFRSDGASVTFPGLILLDMQLPKVDGLEVLRRIRADERTQIIPVVILTSSKQQEDVLASSQGGADSYVRKPVKFADFAEVVRALGMGWLLLAEAPPKHIPGSD